MLNMTASDDVMKSTEQSGSITLSASQMKSPTNFKMSTVKMQIDDQIVEQNRKIKFLFIAMVVGASFVVSCGVVLLVLYLVESSETY